LKNNKANRKINQPGGLSGWFVYKADLTSEEFESAVCSKSIFEAFSAGKLRRQQCRLNLKK